MRICTVGVEFDCLSRFTVSSAWDSSLSHNTSGKEGSVPANIEMKWFLKIFIPTSATYVPSVATWGH